MSVQLIQQYYAQEWVLDYCKEQAIDLQKRVTAVSGQTMQIIAQMPEDIPQQEV